jgi:hypothetical protein
MPSESDLIFDLECENFIFIYLAMLNCAAKVIPFCENSL